MRLDKERKCIYEINADKGIKCECSECKNCEHYKNVTNNYHGIDYCLYR